MRVCLNRVVLAGAYSRAEAPRLVAGASANEAVPRIRCNFVLLACAHDAGGHKVDWSTSHHIGSTAAIRLESHRARIVYLQFKSLVVGRAEKIRPGRGPGIAAQAPAESAAGRDLKRIPIGGQQNIR